MPAARDVQLHRRVCFQHGHVHVAGVVLQPRHQVVERDAAALEVVGAHGLGKQVPVNVSTNAKGSRLTAVANLELVCTGGPHRGKVGRPGLLATRFRLGDRASQLPGKDLLSGTRLHHPKRGGWGARLPFAQQYRRNFGCRRQVPDLIQSHRHAGGSRVIDRGRGLPAACRAAGRYHHSQKQDRRCSAHAIPSTSEHGVRSQRPHPIPSQPFTAASGGCPLPWRQRRGSA